MKEIYAKLDRCVRHNIPLTILVLLAAILHLSIILPSGSHYCFNGICGDFFWGVHEHDGIWHMAAAQTAFKSFPPLNPIYEGLPLSRYNSLLDFVLFVFSLIGISPFFMYFKILPVIWFITFTYTSFRLSALLNKKKIFSFMFLFLSYFGASFSFIIPLLRAKTIEGTSSLLAMQAVLTLTNLQLAFSYVILFLILILLHEKKLLNKQIALVCLYVFLQWGLKFYVGFMSSVIIGVVFFVRFLKEKNKKYIFYITLIGISSLFSLFLNYNPFGQQGGGPPFVFDPLALIWPLVEDPSMFYSYYWSNAKYTLLASNHISPRLISFMSVLTLLYIFLNLGPRILGFFYLIKKNISKKRSEIDLGILAGVVLSLIFPILFVQRGVWWNTVQFLFPVFLMLNMYTAGFIADIKVKGVRVALITTIIILSIPYAIDALRGFTTYPGIIYISDGEKEALAFLKKIPDGVVYTPLFNSNSALNKKGVIPLFNHVDSAYIPAYTGKQVLYANYVQLNLLNIDYQGRREMIKNGDCSLLSKIIYAYIPVSQNKDIFFKKCINNNKEFKRIFNNSTTLIYSKIK